MSFDNKTFDAAMLRLEEAGSIYKAYVQNPETFTAETKTKVIDLLISAYTLLTVYNKEVQEAAKAKTEHDNLKKLIGE
jgi:hypothetical protein